MNDAACVEFLQWALPKLSLRWPGFRKVRSQVCKRVHRRIRALGLEHTDAYRAYLETHPDEWGHLDSMCRITISRFCRDRAVFNLLHAELIPKLAQRVVARGDTLLRCWSAGCAAGEEVYTLVILWERGFRAGFPDLQLRVTATDVDANMLNRARDGRYQESSLKELPDSWIAAAFDSVDRAHRIRSSHRGGIDWLEQDVRLAVPQGPFDLVLCRNLVFTYFAEALQLECLTRIAGEMRVGAPLVLGKHEALPKGSTGFVALDHYNRIFRRT